MDDIGFVRIFIGFYWEIDRSFGKFDRFLYMIVRNLVDFPIRSNYARNYKYFRFDWHLSKTLSHPHPGNLLASK